MIAPRLVMILASAGAGKTFALTNRFIALLAAGAAPERIVALTFTRKAAGEFFDGILGKLADAAADKKRARELALAIGRGELAPADFLRLLRAMIDALHRLRLGTLDSFFAQIAQAFPFELGLAGDFEVIEGHAVRVERERALRLLFARSGGKLDEAQRGFLEAFKQATFGTEEKRLAARLDRFLDEKYETFLEVPAAERWGGCERIWPDGPTWVPDGEGAAVRGLELRRWLAGAAMNDGQRARWSRLVAELEEWSPGAPWGDAMNYFLPRLLATGSELAAGRAEITVDRRKQAIDVAGGAVLTDVLRGVIGGELQRQIAITRGVHAVLAHFDEIYGDLVRRAGKLTFGDVTRLLHPDDGGRALSFAGAAEGRLMLDYRLDAGIDHWLLDEFQDTSRSQWSVLRNLIDEVVQDAEERRTFFCVGDVKQSIYGWRDGDPTLMRDIRRHYNGSDEGDGPCGQPSREVIEERGAGNVGRGLLTPPGCTAEMTFAAGSGDPALQRRRRNPAIATQPLDASWRSGPAVIAMVNGVFGAQPVLEALFPAAACERWKEEWREHTTERRDREGQAALLFAADAAERARRTLELIQEIDPRRRGLTCAVLTRSNDQAAELADFLRREGGVAAVAESDLCVCTDNPLGAALLALVQAAAHPGDNFAWEHVQMSPLGAALAAAGLASREAVTRATLRQVSEEGFERWAEHWLARLPITGAFAGERARQFAAAAALFDATGRRDPDEFGQFMAQHQMREPESAAVVRVMTIHKSKGLGFDVVILPELQGRKLDLAPAGLSVHRGAQHEPEWVLELPRKEIVEADPTLRAHAAGGAADACYEALSLLYVAMTRAKHAMFAVIEAPKESRNYPRLLVDSLGGAAQAVRVGRREFEGSWSAGDPVWFEGFASRSAAGKEAEADWPLVSAPAVPRRVARRPSGGRGWGAGAAQLFAQREPAALGFGAAVHELLAEVEWCERDQVDARAAAWRARGEDAVVIEHVTGVLRAPELAGLWAAPSAKGRVEVWRERSFEVVLGNSWVTGIFDRVVVVRDAAGRAIEATVFDFKTDAVTAGVAELELALARHAEQLGLYRLVVARLTGLAPSQVAAEVVFTGLALRRAIPAAK